ncbi:MAG: RNA polymerase sigma factor [Deltaproteobacteria bacterium]|nr:RNA polymerase sigma factor [Deltaproteobacteria bacterium]MBK8694937.1 RNA polymerase sigma factor [Deltaproteobacteria bacterium]
MPPTREASEAELDDLMARVSEGEREAFTPLFRALHPRALRVAARRLDPARADEVAQAAMVKLFTRAAAFTPGRPALPWFYAVVANEVRAELRRNRHAAGAVPEHHPSPEAAADDALAERELRRALQQSVDALDPTSAEAIAVLLGEGAPPPIAPATHRKRLSRAYARLRALLGGDL